MNLIFLKGYNNYHDRIIKKELSISDYLDKSKGYYSFEKINFNPNDDVDTELIINWKEDWIPDYMLAYEDLNEIALFTRWFIIEAVRTRGRQYHLSLHRDVIADNLEELESAPCYIQKGMLKADDSFIYNSEGVNVNQIKKEELLLKDKTRSPWIVAYVSKDFGKDLPKDIKTVTAEGGTIAHEINQDVHTKTFSFGTDKATQSEPSSYVELNSLLPITQQFFQNAAISGEITPFIKQSIGFIVNSNFHNYAPNTALKLAANTYSSSRRGYSYTNQIITTNENGVFSFIQNQGNTFDKKPEYKSLFGEEKYDAFPAAGISDRLYQNFDNIATKLMSFSDNQLINRSNAYPGYIDNKYDNKFYQALLNDNEIYTNKKYYFMKPSEWKQIVNVSADRNFTYEDRTPLILELKTLNNKWIKFADGIFRKFKLVLKLQQSFEWKLDCNKERENNEAYEMIKENNSIFSMPINEPHENEKYTLWGYITGTFDIIDGNLSETFKPIIKEQIESTIRDTCANNEDDAFNIIYMPYADNIAIKDASGIKELPMNKLLIRNFAHELSTLSPLIYDVQLLPYCPNTSLRTTIDDNRLIIDITGMTAEYDYDEISKRTDQTLTQIGIFFYGSHSSGTFNILLPEKAWLQNSTNPIEIKLKNELDLVRMSSPNYNGTFEFKPVRNGGVSFINVDFTYKPYSPYIHLNPDFKNLYGSDFNDSRGLICGGNFSLTQITDKWKEFELNNKNYQQLFNRELRNMDVSYSIEHEKAIWSAVTGGMSSAISGAIGGGLIGAAAGSSAGPVGAIVGAAVGGTAGIGAGVVGGVRDVQLLEQQYQENRSFRIDNFAVQTANIAALPETIRVVTAFSENNKLFPFLEYYTCTDEEKQAFIEKLKYNSMTINRIDKLGNIINNYIENIDKQFIQAKLIRSLDVIDDAHVKLVIDQELQKGIYI